WGPDWGENGYFRIRWGECQTGEFASCIWNQVGGEKDYSVSLSCDSLTLTAGDSAEFEITIKNQSSTTLACHIVDAGFNTLFHPDSIMAFDDTSLWCGDPDLCGYPGNFLENLDTPLLDLTGTINPKLTFMTQWAIAPPFDGKTYDGADGCNVWASDDGGKNYTIIRPSYPAYTCEYLYGFSSNVMPLWGFDDPIPGWAGFSNGWVPAEFDLSAFQSDSVVIRFSFAADEDTINQSEQTGFFIDEILITDNEQILYENHGYSFEGMCNTGLGVTQQTDWLHLEQNYVSIIQYDSVKVPVSVHTHTLEPDTYHGNIFVFINDTTRPNMPLFFDLLVEPADHDIALKSILSPGEFIPILCPITPQVRIKNIGKNTESEFGLALELSVDNMPAYTDTVSNLTLASMQSMTVLFDPMVLTDKADYEMNVYPVDLPEDNNLLNNGLETRVMVSNLIDDFEHDPVLWTIDRDWKIAEFQTAYEGTHCATIRADNDSDAVLIFNPALDLSLTDQARIQYRIRSGSSEGQQICYFEISPDSLSWTRADSVTGRVEWEQRQVDLTPMIQAGHDNLWFRFYYHTEKVRKKDVFWIDNIEIYPEDPSGIERDRIRSPYTWKLAHNYPNPFNPVTNIQYTLPVAAHVEIRIFNALGQQVASLIDEKQQAGVYQMQWDGSCFPSGLYFYRIQAGEFCDIKKCMLLK
ncbi:T9SS type A sorting domain-containing protein, partial [bacterium]|nr:T9SS type A sorting domain-containing protein [bacterium]